MKTTLAVIFGLAALSAIPASAGLSTFNFSTGATNSNLSSYAVQATVNGQTVTATETAYYVTGTTGVPGTGNFATGEVGTYGSAGTGICENQTGNDCAQPNHQINNGTDKNLSGGDGTGTDSFEFMLIKFNVAIDLSSIQLGNFGTTGTANSSGSPFNATYYVSSSSATSLSLSTTSISTLGTDGFGGAQQTSCSAGTCGINGTGTDNLSGNNVTYLLLGASTQAGQAGTDFFKIQDINVNPGTVTTSQVTPEPATFGLIGLSLAGLGLARRRRKNNS